jgi:hypothetical protein
MILKNDYKTEENFTLKIAAAKSKNHKIRVKLEDENVAFDSYCRLMKVPKVEFRFAGQIFLNSNMGDRTDWHFWMSEDFLSGFQGTRPLFPTDRGCKPWHVMNWSNMLHVNTKLRILLEGFGKGGVFYTKTMVYDCIALDRNDREYLRSYGDPQLEADVYITGFRPRSNLAFIYLIYFFPSLLANWEFLSTLIKNERFNLSWGLTCDGSVRNQGHATWQLLMSHRSIQAMVHDYLVTINSTLEKMKNSITYDSPRGNKKIGCIPLYVAFDEKSPLVVRYRITNPQLKKLVTICHSYNTSYKCTIARNGKTYAPSWRYEMTFTQARYVGQPESFSEKLEAECQRLLQERDLTTGSGILFRTVEQQREKDRLDEKKTAEHSAKLHKAAMPILEQDKERTSGPKQRGRLH